MEPLVLHKRALQELLHLLKARLLCQANDAQDDNVHIWLRKSSPDRRHGTRRLVICWNELQSVASF